MPRKNVFVSKDRVIDLQRFLIILRKIVKNATLSLLVERVILAEFASKMFTIRSVKLAQSLLDHTCKPARENFNLRLALTLNHYACQWFGAGVTQ